MGEASVLTAQLALPREICAALYASDARFSDSIANLNQLTLQGDNVFGDNSAAELAQQTLSMSGDAAAGFQGRATIPVDFNAGRSAGMAPGGPPPGAGGDMPPPPPN